MKVHHWASQSKSIKTDTKDKDLNEEWRSGVATRQQSVWLVSYVDFPNDSITISDNKEKSLMNATFGLSDDIKWICKIVLLSVRLPLTIQRKLRFCNTEATILVGTRIPSAYSMGSRILNSDFSQSMYHDDKVHLYFAAATKDFDSQSSIEENNHFAIIIMYK